MDHLWIRVNEIRRSWMQSKRTDVQLTCLQWLLPVFQWSFTLQRRMYFVLSQAKSQRKSSLTVFALCHISFHRFALFAPTLAGQLPTHAKPGAKISALPYAIMRTAAIRLR